MPRSSVSADAYAPVRTEEDPSATRMALPVPTRHPASPTSPTSPPWDLPSASASSVGGFVNEVTFGFFDGAADAPAPEPRLRSYASQRRVSQHSALHARANQLQHLAGGSGVAGPASVYNLCITTALLLMLGVIPSTIIFLVDLAVHHIFNLREAIATKISNSSVGFVAYLASGVLLCLMSTFVCHVFSMEAEGSGIPQMKAIMSGFYDRMKPALSVWALLAKTIALICAIGGGLPIGWEGPNVHIACIVAHHLCRLPFFSSLRRDRALRMQIMACACAVGLASSFGAPIGGVLYALETTASFYLVPTFWKSLVASMAGTLVCNLLYKTPLVEAVESTTFAEDAYTRRQLINFAVMGMLFGVIGAFFVRCVHSVYIMRKKALPGTNRYVLLAVVATVAALVQYPLHLFRLDARLAINEFFSATNLESLSSLDVALLVLIKFPLIVVSIGLPVPAGVFIPSFLLGSGLGRLYGEALRLIFGKSIVPGGYAVVGAAAFTAGVTRALSCAVVIFEVTGQLKHLEPTLVAVALSVVVANSINRSLYDTLIIMKELPYMPHMRRDRSPAQTVSEVMNPDVAVLFKHTTLGRLRDELDAHPSFDSFPVVNDSGLLLGSIRRPSLVALLNIGRGGVAVQVGKVEDPSLKARQRERRRNNGGNDHLDREQFIVEGGTAQEANRECFSLSNEGDVGHEEGEDSTARNPKGQPLDKQTTTSDTEDAQLSESQSDKVLLDNPSRDGQRNDSVEDFGADEEVILEPDLSPLVVTDNTMLSQLHFMFVMLMPTHAFVLSRGQIAGIITRGDIVQTGSHVIENNVPGVRPR